MILNFFIIWIGIRYLAIIIIMMNGKNKMQAELLSTIPVSLDYLKKIIFRCETDMKKSY